jgi:hypothetical protein
MLNLSTAREPFWLDMPLGARVRFRPVTIAMILVARAAAADALKVETEDAMTLAAVAFTRSLAQAGIMGWEGIGDADGKPVLPSPEAIDALLEHWQIYDAIDRLYVGPALIGTQEKNASSPLPNGTSVRAEAVAKATVRRAQKHARPAPT